MKPNQRNQLLLAVIAISVVVINGCAGSSLQVINLNIEAQPDTTIEVMPFVMAKKRFATSDAESRGPIGALIESGTGAYTYRFDNEDYAILRKSIIESLRKGGSFNGIQDVPHEADVGTGTRLYVNFVESGLESASWGGIICAISAYAWIEDATGNVLASREIAIAEKSGTSVGAAKDKAISKFVREVSGLFVTNSK
jgi:hypothetical protein